MRYFLFLAFFLLFANYSHCLKAIETQQIYLVRHAEKLDDGSKDPGLNEAGIERAEQLAQWLLDKNIKKVFTTDYLRTRQTANPLAQMIKSPAIIYDPAKLPEFAEEIKKTKENLLIVGHSNTTPYLAYLLGGDYHADIDESEYDRLYQLIRSGDLVTTTMLKTQPEQRSPPVTQVPLDLTQFKAMKNTYQMQLNGKLVGNSIHNLQKLGNQIILQEKTLIPTMGIDTEIEVGLNSAIPQTIYMSMNGTMGGPTDIQLNWSPKRVAGYSLMPRSPYKTQGKITVDQPISNDTLERTASIMLAHLMKVAANRPKAFNWYNGYDNARRKIVVSYQGDETIIVPAGEFETRKIQLLGGAPSQLFYISKEEQPKIIKIEILSMPWVYVLEKSERI